MGKLAASIQIHFDAHPSSEIAEKFHSLHASLLDFQKKMLGPAGPQVFIFGWLNKTVFYNLGQNKWKTYTPPPPQIKDGKMVRFCPSRAFILDLGGMGVCCSILFCPRL